MRLTKFSIFILLFSCSNKCIPKWDGQKIDESLAYMHMQCMNAGFGFKKCQELETKRLNEIIDEMLKDPCQANN